MVIQRTEAPVLGIGYLFDGERKFLAPVRGLVAIYTLRVGSMDYYFHTCFVYTLLRG